jgi:hypothetical protein
MVSPVTAPTMEIPAAWLVDGAVLPDRCVRHGAPATRRVDLIVRSRPAHAVRVPGWPLCRRCTLLRVAGLAGAGVLFGGGLVAVVAGRPAGALLAGVAALVAAGPALALGRLSWLTRVQLSPGGAVIRVVDPHPDFEARLRPTPPRRA